MVEHRMYLAMPGIALAAGGGFAWVFRRRRALALAVGAASVVAFVTLTFLRNEVWRSPVSLWSDAVAGSPNNPRAHVNLGLALLTAGQPTEAVRHYCRALALDPENRQARVNLDAALEDQTEARLEDNEDVDLEGLPTGADGSLGLEPPDPCRNR
jgi:tetratricopeptide (TPR) repeat protein